MDLAMVQTRVGSLLNTLGSLNVYGFKVDVTTTLHCAQN